MIPTAATKPLIIHSSQVFARMSSGIRKKSDFCRQAHAEGGLDIAAKCKSKFANFKG
jgi:hypothetical protein